MPLTLLKQIELHQDDAKWLHEHSDDVYQGIHDALFKPDLLQRGIDLLIKIFPSVLSFPNLGRWLDVFYEALLQVMALKDTDRLMYAYTFTGAGELSRGEPKRAAKAFQNALERAEEAGAIYPMLHAYMGIFKSLTFRHDDDIEDHHIPDARRLANMLDNPEITALLYHIIGGVYLERGDTATALGYCQTAFAWWYHQPEKQREFANSAFYLAALYRHIRNNAQAESFLELAKQAFLKTDEPGQYGLIAYEQGSQCRKQGDMEAAIQWREVALREFLALDAPRYQQHYLAMTYQALGNAHLELQHYNEARSHLRKGLILWRQMDNKYQQAQVWFSLAYVEKGLGRPQRASRFLKKAARIGWMLPDTPMHQALVANIEKTSKEI